MVYVEKYSEEVRNLCEKFCTDIGIKYCDKCGKKIDQPYALSIIEIMEEDAYINNICHCKEEYRWEN